MNMPSAEFSTSDTTSHRETESIGATVLMRALADEDVEFVWGYPGGSVLYIYDELYKQDKFQHILVRHEQAAVHAADAYARSTGKVGVCLVTSGPGVTNAVTGIATAYMDSIPLVVISGQVPTAAIGQDAFQECDTVGITRPCVKHNFLVKDVRDLAATVKKAFYHRPHGPARSGADRHSERRVEDALRVRAAQDRFAAFVQPGDERPLRPDPQGGVACCCPRSVRISIPAAASSSRMRRVS